MIKARDLHSKLFHTEETPWTLSYLQAAFRAWWLAEYSGFYVDDPPEAAIPPNTDLDLGKCLCFDNRRQLTRDQRTGKGRNNSWKP